MIIRTRFAPSPTGVLHIGSVRTALFCWLYSRHHAGQFVLRIEDTDRLRSTEENVQAILDGLEWLGIDPDEGPYFQSQRMERYREVIADWLANARAYRCYCTKEELDALRQEQMAAGEHVRYDGRCRERTDARAGVDPVVRFRNPQDGQVIVDDLVRGRVVFENSQLDDLIIARSDGSPTYNFTVVVDDSDMEISHVIRGDDHLNNTPRQINMFAALEKTPPRFAHLPMILGPDGAKLSKRHGAVDIREYREQGYLPDAVLNYLVRLGWSHGDQEIFTREDMVRLFDITNVNQSASMFNAEKMRWLSQQHIIRAPAEVLGSLLKIHLEKAGLNPKHGPPVADVADAYRERAQTIAEMAASAAYLYVDDIDVDAGSAKKHLRPVIQAPMNDARARLAELEAWSREDISRAIEETAEACGIKLGKIGQPIRVAVTGGPVSPPIDVTLELVGRNRTLARLDSALKLIQDRAG